MTGLRRRPIAGEELDAAGLLEWLGDDPGVRANMVTSPDGHATIRGRVGDLTGEADQALLLALRGWCDVLLVGAGTIRAEGYGVVDLPPRLGEIRQARGQAPRPVLAIVSGSLDLDPALPAFAEAGPDSRPWVVTVAGADPARRARLEPYAQLLEVAAGPDGRPLLPVAVEGLRTAGLPRVLSEGGPTVLAELVGAGVVDELFLTVSPTLVGGEGPRILHGHAYPEPVDLRLLDVLGARDEVFLRYAVGAGSRSGGADRA
ncbi:Pyrimidine reductase, riboflavin biosynthesis [Raineyella antarctica]|uniref:Pyrimidine reductase, riboflavin biosynthesis n=1 Tax=Raineyella antarctica TaxID=1577474 RepID=A0A1G6GF82_9ACTN|nr:dihydrofolate reductase family protein [Raineyella antarctica]SDB80493.1 Pyrimidine reductase, riboflavin biosynthesis [Raineyella antarctica]